MAPAKSVDVCLHEQSLLVCSPVEKLSLFCMNKLWSRQRWLQQSVLMFVCMSKVCSCVHRWKNLLCCVEQCLFEQLHNKQTMLPFLAYEQSSLCHEQSLLCYFPLKQGLFMVNKLQETFAQVLANKPCIFLELSKVCS
jgi:hypothetical protein